MEDGYRESIQTTGTGDATVFQNGTAIPATWSKASRTAQLEILDTAGKPIALNRGQTWIAAVPATGAVRWQ
jgi:phage protein U